MDNYTEIIMGCGTSDNSETADANSKRDLDELMGKKIPKVCLLST